MHSGAIDVSGPHGAEQGVSDGLEKPKPLRRALKLSSNSTFSGRTSRWQRLCACVAVRAEWIWWKKVRARSSGSAPLEMIRLKRSQLAQYSSASTATGFTSS